MIDTVAIDERIGKCEGVLRDNPHSQIFAALAEALRKKGELDAAFRVCLRGLRRHSDYGAGHLVMARINHDRKMYDWAEKELSEAIRLDGRTRVTDILETEILIEQGFFSKAAVRLSELINADPANEYLKALQEKIKEGKISMKAKLAETEEFYEASLREKKADEFMQTDGDDENEPVTYESVLDRIFRFSGVEVVFYTNYEGLVGEAMAPDGYDMSTVSAPLTDVCRFVGAGIGSIHMGDWRELLIENSSGIWALIALPDRILGLRCQTNINFGSLKLKVVRLCDSLRNM
jgi:predicted regulator of Ras-like GTPase activity (Roadblock/LC7/MglB family)